MNDADYELIMAYVDGETAPEETERAEALLAARPEAREVLSRLRAVDDQVRASLHSVLDEPVPERLTRATSAQEEPRGRLFRFPSPAPSHWALVASLVLALAAVFFWAGNTGPDSGAVRTFVYQTLDQAPSGERRTHPDHAWQVMPLASYQAGDGRLCREYTGRTGDEILFGLACRSDDGRWQTLVSRRQASTDGYQPASGTSQEITVMLQGMDAGDPLSAEQEAVLLDRPAQ